MRLDIDRQPPFEDRADAGRVLAQRLLSYRERDDVIVLALPRGGVPVAAEIARALSAPLDVFLVRKLGVPGHEELAMGAIAQGDVIVLNEHVVRAYGLPRSVIERVAAAEGAELRRREAAYRGDRGPLDIRGKTVILVDDGLATGATMRAAAKAVRAAHPRRLVIAAPVGSPEACAAMRDFADEVVCPRTPDPLYAIGYAYDDFSQTTDDEVRDLLASCEQRRTTS